MKKILSALLICLISACATTPTSTKLHPKKPSDILTVTAANGRPVASVDQSTGEIEYYGAAEDAFAALMGWSINYMKECPCCKHKEAEKKEAEKPTNKKK
jgi:hypothetical protein